MYSACAHTHAHRHLDIKPLSVLARGREGEGGGWGEKKLQHISGIFQLMMCGCGSTGEREPLTVLSLFRSPRAPCCIPVHCAYFGNSCSAPFFSVLLYTVCVLLLHFSFQSCRPVSPSRTFPTPLSPFFKSSLPLLISFLGLPQLYCGDGKLSFLQNKRKRESEGGVK